jgi:ABC-type amino acid transport substrate-binding protein
MTHDWRTTRRGLLLGAAGLGAAAAMLGRPRLAFAETTLERAKAQGYIRVGFANEAPFGYATPDGKLTGEAPEVAKAVLAKMGIPQVDGVLTEFGSLIPGLKAGRFDIIAAGMFITPKRCAEIAFSEPSYGIGQAMLVKKGDPQGHQGLQQHQGEPGPQAGRHGRRGRGRLRQGRRRPAEPAGRAARPVEPAGRGAVGAGRRRGADRALDRRHGEEGRRRRIDASPSARSPASR